jgi:hypothetical protein
MRKSNNALKGFYTENKTAIIVVVVLFLAYKVWGIFSGMFGSVGETISAQIASALAKAKTDAQSSTDKNTVAVGLPASVTYKASSADTVRYRAAAQQTAQSLGTMPGQISNVLFTDDAGAYSAIKPYGKALWGAGGLALVDAKGVLRTRPLSARYDFVIAPFYKEITGRSLQTDLDAAFPASPGFASSADFKARCSYYRKYIRV